MCSTHLHGELCHVLRVYQSEQTTKKFPMFQKRIANCFPMVLICIHSICFLRICLRTGFVPKMWMFPWFSNPQLWFKNSSHVVEENKMSCCIGISNKVMKVMGCSVLWIFLSMWFFLSKLPHGNNGMELAVTDVEIRTPERWHDDIQEQHNFWNTFDFALNGTSEAKIVLVLQANVVGGTMIFLQNILTPNCMVVTPMAPIKTIYSASKIGVNVSVKFGSVFARTTFPKLLSFLAAKKDMFDKILINHPLGFPLDFLRALFEMNKRYISITHDYVWVLDNVQPTFAEMRKPGGTSRNYVFKPMLPKLELKSQHIATKTMFGFMDQFESLQVVTMPDYVSSQNVSVETNQTDLVIGVLGNISFIKGLQAVLDISRQRASPTESPSCRSIETGPNYIQLGNWRFGQTSATHLSISHRNNQTPTPAVFRSDGSVQLNPSEKTQRKHSLWTTRGGQCHGSNDGLVKFGKTFLQIGDWRLGQSGGDLVLCHREKKSKPISLGHKQQNASISNAVNIWDHELENMSSVASGSAVGGFDFLKLDDWLLLYKEDELVIVHQYDGPVQSFRSNGKNKKFNQKDRTGNFMVDTSKLYDSSGSCNVPRNVQVVVFGGMGSICGAGNNLHTHQYDNISHFNSLIRKFKPNVFIITSIWPETYSYTLTLAMLTNIPIIVRKTATDFSAAVVERAQQYPKAYFHDFENIESVVTLARKIKATSFTEVSPQLFVPPQWKNLMHPHLFNVVLVASKIITSRALSKLVASSQSCGPEDF